MRVDRYLSTTEKYNNGLKKSVYVVHTDDDNKAIEAVKNRRKMKETYVVYDGFINRKGELFSTAEQGCKKVKAVMVE